MTATHTIVTGPEFAPKRTAGGLDGTAYTCSCGHVVTASLPTIARQWAWDHVDYMNRKASR